MLLNRELVAQEAQLHDGTAEGPKVTKTGKFLVLLSDLTLLRARDNMSVFMRRFPSIAVRINEKELRNGVLEIDLPPQKLLRIKALDQDDKPAVGKTISYFNIHERPSCSYNVKTDANGEIVFCGAAQGSYVVVMPRECDPVQVDVGDPDFDDQEIIFRCRRRP
ncbi:MAG: hypothetical protein L0387_21880 [Acidobacteria bacterium]|nr:hypothetical protein [Acidobacteriota bacterium]